MLATIADEVDERRARHDAAVFWVQLRHDVAHVEGRCLQANISQECMNGLWCQEPALLPVNLFHAERLRAVLHTQASFSKD